MRSILNARSRCVVSRVKPGVVRPAAAVAPEAGDAALSRRAVLAAPLLLSSAAALVTGPPARAEEAEAAVKEAVGGSSMAAVEELAAPLRAAPVKAAVDRSKLKVLSDPILAYSFPYPVETMSGTPLKMTVAHEPEKYSSAAPLNADARQRIVSSLIDFKNFVTVTMTVGPAAGVLKGVSPTEWNPSDVALTVLIDRSTSRTTNGQRFALNDVEYSGVEDRNGDKFFVYEHLSQGSPTIVEYNRETYRHALAVSAVRPGQDGTPYIYTLNLSCREEQWDDLQPLFQESIKEFALLPTTKEYIPPDRNPWLFF